MDFMLVAFAVDLTLWALAGYVVFRIGRRFWPHRFDDPKLVMVAFFIIGALVTMSTFTRWIIYPR
jgi:hypothetical protein